MKGEMSPSLSVMNLLSQILLGSFPRDHRTQEVYPGGSVAVTASDELLYPHSNERSCYRASTVGSPVGR
jgi:hypothetical protein